MKLSDIKQTLRETHHEVIAQNGGVEVTPLQRFLVYEAVLQNMLNDGHITGAQFARWVKVY